MSSDETVKFGYWGVRALGNTPRYILKYGNVKYEDRTYSLGENFDTREDWLREKFNLGLDFPNLPYLIIGNKKITQSLAIVRCLGRMTGLYPNEDSIDRTDMAEQQINDLMWASNKVCYDPNYNEKLKSEYVDNFLTNRCSELDKFLGDHEYFGGDKLTYVDFLAYEMFDQHRTLWPEYEKMYQKHTKIEAFLKRMEALPKFAKILASEDTLKWPMWSEGAFHGGIKFPAPQKIVKY